MIFRVLALLLALAVPASAHNTSVTWIDARIDGSHLDVTLNLNQSDLLEHALHAPPDQTRFTDRRELQDGAPEILTYVTGHLHVSADGNKLAPPSPRDWPPQHPELTHLDAGGLQVPSALAVKLRYMLPPNAHSIEIRPDLYTSPNFAAIFDISLRSSAATQPIMKIADKHQAVSFDITQPQNSPQAAHHLPDDAHIVKPASIVRGWFLVSICLLGLTLLLWIAVRRSRKVA